MQENNKTRKCRNFTDFLSWVKKCGNRRFNSPENNYYRGQGNSRWELVPQIFRNGSKSNDSINYIAEADLLKQADKTAWQYLHGLGSRLEKLIFLQHHGLATRLLDLTRNPLVALYFACEDTENDGCVFKGNGSVDDIIIAEKYAGLLYDKFTADYTPVSKKEIAQAIKEPESMVDAFCYPILVPQVNNTERIIAQSGMFLLPPLFQKYSSRPELYTFQKPSYNFDDKKFFNKIRVITDRIIIPKELKPKLLKQLDTFGINEFTIYHDLDHLLKYLNTEPFKNNPIKGAKLDI